MLPVVRVDFKNIDDEGKVQVEPPFVPNNLTEGSLVKLVNNTGRMVRYATLYEINGGTHYFRIQE